MPLDSHCAKRSQGITTRTVTETEACRIDQLNTVDSQWPEQWMATAGALVQSAHQGGHGLQQKGIQELAGLALPKRAVADRLPQALLHRTAADSPARRA